jgi:lipocalin
VRIFEGINFLSRSPTMSDAQMAAMFARAKAAGMAPYGATPEQVRATPRLRRAAER